MVPEKIAEYRKLAVGQVGAAPTKGSTANQGGQMIARGIGLLVALVVLYFLAVKITGDAQPFIILIGAGLGLGGLQQLGMGIYSLAVGATTSQRSIACPVCGKEQPVMKSVTGYLCTGCGSITRTVGGKNETFCEVHCPQCQAPWISATENEPLPCYACGALVEVTDGQARSVEADAACPDCGKPTAKTATFCPACGALITQPHLGGPVYSSLLKAFRDSPLYEDAEIKRVEGPRGMNPGTVLAVTPLGFVVQAAWIGKLLNQQFVDLEKAQEKHIQAIDMVRAFQRMERGINWLRLAVEQDERLASAAQELAGVYDTLMKVILQNVANPADGKFYRPVTFSNPADYTDKDSSYTKSTQTRINDLLGEVSKEYNDLLDVLVKKCLDGVLPIERWREPLLMITSSSGWGASGRSFSVAEWNWKYWAALPPAVPLSEVRLPKTAR